MKTIVVSGVNLSEGGTLTIIKSFLEFLEESEYSRKYVIYALVHTKNLFPEFKNIRLIEFPNIKRSWLNRIIFEYYRCRSLSKELKSYLWISMHDISPNIVSTKRAVYCHSPSPFYGQKTKDFFKSPLRYLYTKFYKEFYRINILKNNYVIVQQRWIKEEFTKLFGLKKEKIIIALPDQERDLLNHSQKNKRSKLTFIYPALPRDFKNFEIIGKAALLLQNKNITNFEILLTIDGSENSYAKKIYEKFRDIPSINFIGLQSREKIEELYSEVDCLIFPSKLETWGLPITEFKKFNKPMLVADLPYAYETVGAYDKVCFLSPEDEKDLADYIQDLINDKIQFRGNKAIEYESPVTKDWSGMMELLLS